MPAVFSESCGRSIIYRNISEFIYDIVDLVKILWIILLIFVFNCSFLLLSRFLGIICNVF